MIISYLLYSIWNPIYSIILLWVTITSFCFARIINKLPLKKKKKVLTFFVILTLFPLFFFKYFKFLSESLVSVVSLGGIYMQLEGLNWAIPIGISFYTFQSLSYMWDVYYGKIEAEKHFLTYALFISFFPCIISGPINKASLVLPQIKNMRCYFDYAKAVEGLKLILWGMFMKVVVADRLGIYVDTVYDHYMNYSSLSCLMASFLYSIQIYADFGGYSLMALGVGKLLGFELTENFRRPLFSYSVTNFWRRWHISLSTWLKDYIYIPMGGNRCSKSRNYLNIIITFFVSGIWHGANWTFILWGMIHGVIQVLEKAFGLNQCHSRGTTKCVRVLITMLLITIAWVFFRMPNISDALGMIMHILSIENQTNFFWPDYNNYFILFGIVLLLLKDLRDEIYPHKFKLLDSNYTIVRWATYLILLSIILLNGVLGSDQFIYVNF